MTTFPSWMHIHAARHGGHIECHIQTLMINMKSHRHGMYLPLLIKLFSLAVKCFIPKTVRCLWCIVYNLSSLHHYEIKHFTLFWSLRLRISLPKEGGNMEVIICSVYITHIVTGKVLSPSCQQLLNVCFCIFYMHCIAECRHSQSVTVSNLLLHVSLQGSTQHCNTFYWPFQWKLHYCSIQLLKRIKEFEFYLHSQRILY